MRTGKCQTCGREDRITTFFHVNHGLHCEQCANTVVGQLQQQKAPLKVTRGIDRSVCSACGADAGSRDFPLAGRVPLCPACHEKAYNRDFPVWLKAGFALTVVLLVLALAHGAKYFKAGRQYFSGERLISGHKYAQAVAPLRAALAVAPECPKCRLQLAKADLLSGNPEEAFDLVKGRNFETDELAEYQPDFDRADRAIGLFNKATEQFNNKDMDGALAHLQQAAQIYPEWPEPALAEHSLRIGQAFLRKDYDGFLQLTQADWDKNENADSAGALSAALACKYALTGQEEYKQRAEEMYALEGKLATTPEQEASHEEFRDRLQYRLEKRDIIDKAEYDRRFRKKPDVAAKPATEPNEKAAGKATSDQKSQ
jgi:hypothetical protein